MSVQPPALTPEEIAEAAQLAAIRVRAAAADGTCPYLDVMAALAGHLDAVSADLLDRDIAEHATNRDTTAGVLAVVINRVTGPQFC